MAWNSHLMFAVGQDQFVYGHDLRKPKSLALVLEGHKGAVCSVNALDC